MATCIRTKKSHLCFRTLEPHTDIICGLLPWRRATCQSRRVFHMLPLRCHPACTQPTPEEGVCCITSFANKKHSVGKAAQMVCKDFSRPFRTARAGL